MKRLALVACVLAGCVRTADSSDDDGTCGTVELANPTFDKDLVASEWIHVGTSVFVEAAPGAPSAPNALHLLGGNAKTAQVVPVPDGWTSIRVAGSWAVKDMIPQPDGVPTPIARLVVSMETTDGSAPLRELGTIDLTDQTANVFRPFDATASWNFGGGPARLSFALATPLDPTDLSIDSVSITGSCN